MRNIYLVRHGETEYEDKKSFCLGRINLHLSTEGVKQAETLHKYFSDKNIEKVFSSSLLRCVETAEIISDKDIIIESALQEINVGEWDGMSFEEIKRRYPGQYEARGRDFENYVPPKGESFLECLNRGKKAFYQIFEFSKKENIVVVAHAGINRALLCWMMGRKLSSMFQLQQPYGCFNIIQYDDVNYNVVEIGKLPKL